MSVEKGLWVFETCKHCGYQNSFEKIDIPRKDYTTEELMKLFSEKVCVMCVTPLKGDLEWYGGHPVGLDVQMF